jgi:predicted DNA-binding WGR domain protein
LPSALDKLISDARRDRAEYGFAQLRLVVAFLHWRNLKEAPQERIVSPLLLLPVELAKKKGVRDQYILDPATNEAEVNPALRHHLHQLYGLRLPETVDLRETPLEQFHREFEAQIRSREPGVTLRLVDKPEIQLIHERARQRLAQFQRKQRLRTPAKRTKSSFSYSYDHENFRPLGLQLFRENVPPTPLPQRAAAGTIPDRALPAAQQVEIVVRAASDAAIHCEALLARPLSFHFMERSPYETRRNAGEAAYIAQLARELLRRETKLSIGIVAFSEAQQGEIEAALDALASDDATFAARLEEEYTREEEDQFCGLFVKNLENVQGDERDIILLSICYGPDASGRMLMNFGPINQRGGEKRLNVIFSRARHHMAVVSSIRHHAITNDYNDGAAALKNFLHYAECASRGELRLARGVLESLNPLTRKQLAPSSVNDAVISQLTAELRARGLTVDEHVGQSRFRCDLAVRARDARHYCAGIIVDTARHYANPNVAERCVAQPGILRAFGWQVVLVLTRDWYHEPQAVLDRIERLVRGEAEPRVELEDDVPSPALRVASAPTPSASPPIGPAPQATAPSSGKVRRLEFVEGRSSKFWEVAQDGCSVTVRYGRIGTQGQTQTKTFDTAERAAREVEKLTAEKLRKGYHDSEANP